MSESEPQPEPVAAAEKRREKWKLSAIKRDVKYGGGSRVRVGNEVREITFLAEPTDQEIAEAVAAKAVDERFYSGEEQAALYAAFEKEAAGNFDTYRRLIHQYHARRVAYFVLEKDWKDPIGVTAEGILHDGGHRYLAAKFLGKDEVEVEIG